MSENHESEKISIPNGKHGLIAKIAEKTVKTNPETILGIGDDAAVINSGNLRTLVSTDMFVEGIHFNLVYTPLKHLGWKVVSAAIADIIAMNAQPKQVMVSIAVSNILMQSQILEIFDGVKLACEHYKVDLAGGDITSSMRGLTICVTAIGTAKEDDIVYRSGARPTDLICVTGNLGGAYMGLQLLERERSVFESTGVQPKLDNNDYILRRQLRPEAQIELLDYFKKKEIKPTSMIDLSTGLADELMNLCRASDMGCEIFEERIPIADETKKMAEEFGIMPVVAALNGGEDYEMLFTIELKEYEKIKDNDFFTLIGSINTADKGSNIVMTDGNMMPLQPSNNI
ncbi:MAG: thiamine-phosphate kinase [Bacteroidales bacterium]|nr:thiamine-phosphate kinase [Bacteroidales bacterium]